MSEFYEILFRFLDLFLPFLRILTIPMPFPQNSIALDSRADIFRPCIFAVLFELLTDF